MTKRKRSGSSCSRTVSPPKSKTKHKRKQKKSPCKQDININITLDLNDGQKSPVLKLSNNPSNEDQKSLKSEIDEKSKENKNCPLKTPESVDKTEQLNAKSLSKEKCKNSRKRKRSIRKTKGIEKSKCKVNNYKSNKNCKIDKCVKNREKLSNDRNSILKFPSINMFKNIFKTAEKSNTGTIEDKDFSKTKPSVESVKKSKSQNLVTSPSSLATDNENCNKSPQLSVNSTGTTTGSTNQFGTSKGITSNETDLSNSTIKTSSSTAILSNNPTEIKDDKSKEDTMCQEKSNISSKKNKTVSNEKQNCSTSSIGSTFNTNIKSDKCDSEMKSCFKNTDNIPTSSAIEKVRSIDKSTNSTAIKNEKSDVDTNKPENKEKCVVNNIEKPTSLCSNNLKSEVSTKYPTNSTNETKNVKSNTNSVEKPKPDKNPNEKDNSNSGRSENETSSTVCSEKCTEISSLENVKNEVKSAEKSSEEKSKYNLTSTEKKYENSSQDKPKCSAISTENKCENSSQGTSNCSEMSKEKKYDNSSQDKPKCSAISTENKCENSSQGTSNCPEMSKEKKCDNSSKDKPKCPAISTENKCESGSKEKTATSTEQKSEKISSNKTVENPKSGTSSSRKFELENTCPKKSNAENTKVYENQSVFEVNPVGKKSSNPESGCSANRTKCDDKSPIKEKCSCVKAEFNNKDNQSVFTETCSVCLKNQCCSSTNNKNVKKGIENKNLFGTPKTKIEKDTDSTKL